MDALGPEAGQVFYLARAHWQVMQADAARRAPEEACGLVAGLDGRSQAVYPLTNVLHSPVRYRLDPQEQWAAFQSIEAQGWELAAIYHSHPAGPPHPSATDVAESYYPECVYLIWTPAGAEWQCRAFRITAGRTHPIRLEVLEIE